MHEIVRVILWKAFELTWIDRVRIGVSMRSVRLQSRTTAPTIPVDGPPVPNHVPIHYHNRRIAQAPFLQAFLRQSFSYGTGDTKISADSSDMMD